MPKNFLQKSFTHWLDKNIQRFNHPPCNMTYKEGGIQFKLQGIIPELQWHLSKSENRLHAGYTKELFLRSRISQYYTGKEKHNVLWESVAECDVYEQKNNNGEYFCYWGSLSKESEAPNYIIHNDLLGPSGKCYPSRLRLWEKECFEYVLLLSNACTAANLWLCYFEDDIGLFPTHKLKEIRALDFFIEALDIHKNKAPALK